MHIQEINCDVVKVLSLVIKRPEVLVEVIGRNPCITVTLNYNPLYGIKYVLSVSGTLTLTICKKGIII